MNLSRITRLLKLIGVLQAGRGHNASALAQSCGVSRRTIFRDLDALRRAGAPLQFDEVEQRYRIPDAYYLPPTSFTPEEGLALLVLCYELGNLGRLSFFQPARSAAIKLESNLPSALREYVRNVSGSLHIHLKQTAPLNESSDHYQQLLSAISRRRSVRIRYDGPTEGIISTKLSPYRVLFTRRSWYVIGRSSLHRSTRTFHVGRITHLELLDDTFRVPRNFSVERYFRNAWHMIPDRGRDRNVHVRFQKKVARNVAEVFWHKTQRCELQSDGTLDFRAKLTGLNEFSWWVLGYGDQAEVIEPEELRGLVAGHAAAMLKRYRSHRNGQSRSMRTRKRRKR